jgi:hypothetical protein
LQAFVDQMPQEALLSRGASEDFTAGDQSEFGYNFVR